MRKVQICPLFVAALACTGVAAQSQAQIVRKPTKPIIVKQLPQAGGKVLARQSDVFVAPKLVRRPGASSAASANARIGALNVRIRQRPKMMALVMGQTAGISRLNGELNGVFEPGGDYEIGGAGFGTSTGSVFLRHNGRTIPMRVTHWSDGQIFASLPGDVSGLPDARSIELAVGPAGKPVFKATRFGFRAARADLPLTITDAMFSYDKGAVTRVMGIDVPSNIAPERKSFDGEKYSVSRYVQDEGGKKKCFEPGFDRIRTDVPLKPGFEVTAAYFSHIGYNRGNYAMTWEPGAIRMDYGVDRNYTPRFVLVGGSGSCGSSYTLKVVVTGPRGMPPQ